MTDHAELAAELLNWAETAAPTYEAAAGCPFAPELESRSQVIAAAQVHAVLANITTGS